MKTCFVALVYWSACTALCFAQDPEAIVRVQAGNSLGSGTVFYRAQNGDAFVLTNYHVAGSKGSRVGIEFWNDGKLEKKLPGVVVESRIDQAYTDVAIVRVAKTDLGTLDPPYIPLAPATIRVAADTVIMSRGSPGGVWQCQFVGRTSEADDQRMEFYPRPGGGRSGSSVLLSGKNEIAGLLTWSADKPNYEDHGTDGSNYSSGFGIAQQIDSVWRVIRGQVTTSSEQLPEHYEPLIEHLIEPSILSLPVSGEYQGGVGALVPSPLWGEGQDEGLAIVPSQILPRPFRLHPQPQPSPSPAPELRDMPLPRFDLPSPGPLAEPESQLQPPAPQGDDGLLRRRYGEPKEQPQDSPDDDGILFGRGQGTGPIRGFINSLVGFCRIVVYLLAAYGAFCLFMKMRGIFGTVAKAVVPLALFCLLPAASAFGQVDAFKQELEGFARKWQSEPVAKNNRWGSYAAAYESAKADKSPLLILVTMPGCDACVHLKARLDELDKFGWFNGTKTCIVDCQRDPSVVEQLKPKAYPMLVACEYDESTNTLRQKAVHVGGFGIQSAQPDGVYGLVICVESLELWLIDAGIN